MPPFDDALTVALFANAEQRFLDATQRKLPVPVLLVGGALGSGKTTLLNHILHNKLNLRVTAIVNDLASINIDADVLLAKTERTVRLSNGCACHSLAGALEDGVWQVLQETDGAERVDYIVIEMSGAASDPSRVVQSLERNYGRMTRARLEGVVLVVDADLIAHELRLRAHALRLRATTTTTPAAAVAAAGTAGAEDGPAEEDEEEEDTLVAACSAAADDAAAAELLTAAGGPALWRQLVQSNLVLLNKMDLLGSAAACDALVQLAQRAAPWAEVLPCTRAHVPLPRLLNVEFSRPMAAGVLSKEARARPMGHFLTGGGGMGGMSGTGGGGASGGASAVPAPPTAAAAEARPAPPSAASAPDWAADADPRNHAYQTVEFASSAPFGLAAFQDFLAVALAPSPHVRSAADGRGGVGAVANGSLPAHAALAGARGVLRRARRVKGTAWFAEVRAERWLVQLSGRGRLDLTHDGVWSSRPAIQLVAIFGQHGARDAARLRTALEALVAAGDDAPLRRAPRVVSPVPDAASGADALCDVCDDAVERDDGGEALAAEGARVRALLAADPRFEVVHAVAPRDSERGSTERGSAERGSASTGATNLDAGTATSVLPPPSTSALGKRARAATPAALVSSVVHFQLVGAATIGLQRAQLERTHGVDINELTKVFVQTLNSAVDAQDTGAPKACLLGSVVHGSSIDGGAVHNGQQQTSQAPLPPLFTAQFALGGLCKLEHVWSAVEAAADAVLAREFARLNLGPCDHVTAL